MAWIVSKCSSIEACYDEKDLTCRRQQKEERQPFLAFGNSHNEADGKGQNA